MLDMKGFTRYADDALANGTLTSQERKFLQEQFPGARERMTGLASTVGTAGSFVLVLVALLVGFANGASAQSAELVKASQTAALLAQGCSDKTASTTCDQTRIDQALDTVKRDQQRVESLANLNKEQAVAGGLVLVGFALGIAGALTNPVPGPATSTGGAAGVVAWKDAVKRLKRKKLWIMASLIAQAATIIVIAVIGVHVFSQ